MLTSLLVALAVSAAPSQEPISLASPGLSHLNMSPQTATYYSDHLAQQLALEGMRVITATEISSLIGFERQKQLLGCSDTSSSCIAELANALGVDGLITGSIGKFGQKYQVNVKILAASDGKPLSVHSSRVTGEEALLDELTLAGQKMAKELYAKLHRAPPSSAGAKTSPKLTPTTPVTPSAPTTPAAQVQSTPTGSPGGLRRWSWLPVAVGAASVAGGVVFTMMAGATYSELEEAARATTPLSGVDPLSLKQKGEMQQTLSLILYGVGAAGLVAGGAMYLFGGPSGASPAVSVAPAPGGGVVMMRGAFW